MRPQVVRHGEVPENASVVAEVSRVVWIIANFVQIQKWTMPTSNMHLWLLGRRALAGAAYTRNVIKFLGYVYVAISNAL